MRAVCDVCQLHVPDEFTRINGCLTVCYEHANKCIEPRCDNPAHSCTEGMSCAAHELAGYQEALRELKFNTPEYNACMAAILTWDAAAKSEAEEFKVAVKGGWMS